MIGWASEKSRRMWRKVLFPRRQFLAMTRVMCDNRRAQKGGWYAFGQPGNTVATTDLA
jgi:hypothetical protein